MVSRLRQWLARHDEWEHRILVVIAGAALMLLALVVFSDWGIYYPTAGDSRLYLLSSIVQGLAAVLAVLVTVSLVVTQLAAQSYTPRVVNLRLRDFWLWSAVVIYLVAIVLSLLVLAGLGSWLPADGGDRISVNVALVLALAALAYLVPFTVANIKSLLPERMARRLLQRGDTEALDELLRRAVNEGTMTTFASVLTLYTRTVQARLDKTNGATKQAEGATSLFLSVGRHACQRRSPDAVAVVMRQLTGLIAYCSHVRRQWRSAADVFNEALKELYSYSDEWIRQATDMTRISADYARISLEAGDSFYEIAQVKAQGREDNLLLAIEAYGRALLFYTRQRFPVQHAMTQNNLGIAYRSLGDVRDREANLGMAVAAHQESLKVYTHAAFPVQHAATQNNLGNAYGDLGDVRDKEANLGKAVAAYQEALKVRTLAAFPVDYGGTNLNLGRAYLALGVAQLAKSESRAKWLADAEAALKESVRAFEQEKAESWLERARAALQQVAALRSGK
ncbi:MAG: tetratricopeptide repeat protein [Dehalococcoidia bacterium]|nr:tetratricopeptide repeat protein [Dehalococcoidia bacterium]